MKVSILPTMRQLTALMSERGWASPTRMNMALSPGGCDRQKVRVLRPGGERERLTARSSFLERLAFHTGLFDSQGKVERAGAILGFGG
jgi:hypothetical protein